MDKQEALELMGTSRNVSEWNENRESVKAEYKQRFTNQPLLQQLLGEIDNNGLITKTIQKNKALPKSKETYIAEIIEEDML